MDFDRTYADYLDNDGIAALQALEAETGTRILAYYTPPQAAGLSKAHLEKLQALEEKLCVRLVAYESHDA